MAIAKADRAMPGCIFGRCFRCADSLLLTPVRGFLLAICIGVIVSMGLSGRAAADPRKGAVEPGRSIRFGQPLVTALEVLQHPKQKERQSYDPDSAVHLLGNGVLSEAQKDKLTVQEKRRLDRLVNQPGSSL